jgi:hypothetical protein
VGIIQNDNISFSFLNLTYLNIVQAACSIASTFGFWYIQNYFKIRTKRMFLVTNFFSVFIPFWGMLGLWTKRVGYHNRVRPFQILPTDVTGLLTGSSGSFISTISSLGSSKRPTTPYVTILLQVTQTYQ